jgi:hypothetical protein
MPHRPSSPQDTAEQGAFLRRIAETHSASPGGAVSVMPSDVSAGHQAPVNASKW